MSVYLPDVDGCFEITDIGSVQELMDKHANLSNKKYDALDYFFILDGRPLHELALDGPVGEVNKITFNQLIKLAIEEYS